MIIMMADKTKSTLQKRKISGVSFVRYIVSMMRIREDKERGNEIQHT